MTELRRPEGVKIILRDGTEIPCDMKYLHKDEHGCHIWDCVAEVDFDNKEVLSVHADVLPAYTGFQFPWSKP